MRARRGGVVGAVGRAARGGADAKKQQNIKG